MLHRLGSTTDGLSTVGIDRPSNFPSGAWFAATSAASASAPEFFGMGENEAQAFDLMDRAFDQGSTS